MRYVTLIKVVS